MQMKYKLPQRKRKVWRWKTWNTVDSDSYHMKEDASDEIVKDFQYSSTSNSNEDEIAPV